MLLVKNMTINYIKNDINVEINECRKQTHSNLIHKNTTIICVGYT